MNHRRRWIIVFIIIASAVAVSIWLRPARYPLPDAKDIESIVADCRYGPDHSRVVFDVPLDHWPKIKSALEPVRRDYNPAKWVSTGSLEITMRDGGHVHISLYDLSSLPGAFSAGPTFEQRVYYRGGDSAELARQMSAAITTAQQQGKVREPEK